MNCPDGRGLVASWLRVHFMALVIVLLMNINGVQGRGRSASHPDARLSPDFNLKKLFRDRNTMC